MERKYRIELINWLTGNKVSFILGDTIREAKKTLKVIRRRYSKLWWFRATPIYCS